MASKPHPNRSTIFDAPTVLSDIPGYVSPATGKWVEGRVARKEDLKKAGCREIDPQEFTPEFSDNHYKKRSQPLPEGRRQLSRKEI